MKRDCTTLMERLPAHEDRTGLTLKGLYASAEKDEFGWQIHVRCEAHQKIGETLDDPAEITVALLDSKDRVLDTSTAWLDPETFFDFEMVDLSFFDVPEMPTRIRVHPKRA